MQLTCEARTSGMPAPACSMVANTSHLRIPVCHCHAIFQPFASATFAPLTKAGTSIPAIGTPAPPTRTPLYVWPMANESACK